MDELEEISKHIQQEAGNSANIIYGHSIDESLGEYQRVTVIATSFDKLGAPEHPFDEPEKFDLERALDVANHAPQVMHSGPVSHEYQVVVRQEEMPIAQKQPITYYQPEITTHKAPAVYGHQPFTPSPQPQAMPVANIEVAQPAPIMAPPQLASPSPEHSYNPQVAPRPERVEIKPQTPPFNPAADMVRKREEAAYKAELRRNHFTKNNGAAPQANFSQMEAAPAYARRGYQFDEGTQTADSQTVSRFALSEDQELTQNNKFLHDNVD
jgi:cell division protein FtsZ